LDETVDPAGERLVKLWLARFDLNEGVNQFVTILNDKSAIVDLIDARGMKQATTMDYYSHSPSRFETTKR
jgi:hypothetical protein